ncbi:MAG TPA: hypothetical protein VMV18_03780, partial [bacterium]|nr:hypothetical protein [bacterium]
MKLPSRTRVRAFLGAALGVTLVHMTLVSWAVYRTRTPVEEKLALADRVMYYAMDADRGPQFALSGKERALRLVTHVLLGRGPYDPRQQVVYGVRLRVRAPNGKEIFVRDLYVTSRVSKAGLDGRLWRNENAFAVSGDELITDARSFKVDLPDSLPLNAILDARLLGGPQRGIVKLYQLEPNGDTARETALSARQPAILAEEAARVTSDPLDTIPQIERLALAANDQKRIPAGGERDREYSVRQVFTTPYREDVAALIADSGLDVDRAHAAAVTVRGPAALTLSTWRSPLDPQPVSAAAEPASLSVRALPAAAPHATPLAWTLPLPGGPAVETHPVAIPAGLHTLEITTESEATVRVRVTAPADARIAGFATPSFSRPEGQVVMPDAETVHALVASPDGPAIDLDTATRELHAFAFRLEAWVPLAGDAAVSSASIFAEAIDAKGQRASREELFVGAPRSAFDRALRADGSESAVTDPVNLRLVVPPGTRRLKLTASKDVALRVYAQRPRVAEDERIDAPWDEPLLDGAVWHYVPRRGSGWALIEPRNSAELLEAGKHLGVSGSVRLSPGEPLPAPTPVEPIAETEKQRLVDRERADRESDLIADWGAGLFTGLPTGRDVAVDFGRRSSIAEVEYLAPTSDLGRRAEVFLDGRSVGSFPVDGADGTWRIPHVGAGVHSIRVASTARARFFVDQPPAREDRLLASAAPVAIPTPPPVWRLHTVHKLAPGAPLTLRVDKIGATAETVDVVVYAPGVAPSVQPRLKISVDRGAPAGSRETLFGLPAPDLANAATIPNLDDRAVGYGRIIPVTLGAEIAPGPHTVELANLSGDVWWARASIAPNGPPDPAAHLDKGDAAAFTLEGPANVVLRVARESGDGAGTLSVRDVPARLVSATRVTDVSLDAKTRAATHAVFVGPGVHSLLVTSDVEGRVRVELTAPPRTGIPFGGRAPIPVAEGDAIAPDVRRSQAFVAGPGGTSLVYEVGAQPSTAMRVDAWAIGATNAQASFVGGTLFARFEDASGHTLHDDAL